MPVVGLAQVLVEPVFTGSQRKIAREMDPVARGAGRSAGREMGDGIATGLAAKTPDIEAAVNKAGKAVALAQDKVETARKKAAASAVAEAKAAGDLRVAEEKLHEVMKRETATQSQRIAANNRFISARENLTRATNQNADANNRLTEVTGDLDSAEKDAVKTQEKLRRHLSAVAVETERNSTAWGRLSNSVRSATRGRPMGEWVRTVAKDNSEISKSLDDLAVSVERTGTRGGRAFTRFFAITGVALAGIVPVAGGAGAALLGAAGAVSTLAGDLSRLGGVAALIPAGLMAIGGAAGTLKAAFWGIGDALKEALEVDKRMATMGQNPRLAAMAIEDANLAIVVAEENAALATERASERIADAKRRLRDVVEAVADARIAAQRAVERAEQREIDMADRVGDAQDKVAKARLRLANAKRAAEIGEASDEDVAANERVLTEALEDQQRALKDQKDATRDRKEAEKDVQKQALKGAESIADAQKAIKEATEDAARAQVDAARSVTAAYRNLERVQLQQADAQGKIGENADYYMNQLTPAAQQAAKALLQVYDRLGKVRAIAQENFFTGFAAPLLALADVIIPQLEVGVGAIATALGQGAQQLMASVSDAFDDGVLEGLLLSIADTVNILNGAIDPIVQSFTTLGVVGMEYMPILAETIKELAETFNIFIQDAAADGRLNEWIDAGIQGFKDIGSIISSTVGIFSALNDAARAGGIDATLGGIAAGLDKIEAVMQGQTFQETMSTLFSGAAAGSAGLVDGLKMIGEAFVQGAPAFSEFLRLGGEIVGLFFGGLAQAMSDPNFGSGLTAFLEGVKGGVEDMMPLLPGLFSAFGDILTQLAPLAEKLGPTLIQVFTGFANVVGFLLTTLEPLIEVLVSNEVVLGLLIGAFIATAGASAGLTAAANLQKVATAALRVVTWGLQAAQMAASIAMGLFTSATGLGTRAIVGNSVAIKAHRIGTAIWTTVTKGAALAMRGLNLVLAANPIALVMLLIAGLVAALVWFFTETELGKQIIENVWGFIQGVFKGLVEWFERWVVPHWNAAIAAIGTVMKMLWTKYVDPVVGWIIGAAKNVYKFFSEDLPRGFRLMRDNAGAMMKGLWDKYVDPVIQFILDAGKNVYDFFTKDIPKGFELAQQGVAIAWKKIQDAVKEPVKFVVNRVINDGLINGLNMIPGVDIPKLELPKGFARGGILPGYQPMKKDDILTPMRRGEGVLVPEVVRGIGAPTIHALNKAGNMGGVAAVRSLVSGGLHPGRAKGGFIHPIPGAPVTSPFGMRAGGFHNGIDFGMPTGTPVRAAGDGVVARAGWTYHGGGNQVEINHPNGLVTWYSHLSSIAAKTGEMIKANSIVGRVGSTGNSTGPHLHYMVMDGGYPNYMNPAPYLSGGGAAGTGKAQAGPPEPQGMFGGLIGNMMDWLKEKFPAGGMFIDAAAGLVTSGINKVISWIDDIKNGIKNIAGDVVKNIASFFGFNHGNSQGRVDEDTLFRDNGGILPPGVSRVLNATGRNEYVLNPQQWSDIHRLATQRFEGAGGDTYHVQLPERASVDDLVDAVGFQQRRNARGGARR